MIHYHGGPVTPVTAAMRCWRGRHAFISFATPEQVGVAAEVCQSFAFDNGAFSAWKSGNPIGDWEPYYQWVDEWKRHLGFDWAIIPDVIDGTEQDNGQLISQWPHHKDTGVPVWHMHESIHWLEELCSMWPRVAIGSSAQYSVVGSDLWWDRITMAMNRICSKGGYPMAKLHGLRMLNPAVFQFLPFSSADSTNVAQNIGIDSAWRGTYTPASKATRAIVIAERVEQYNSTSKWVRKPEQRRLFT